MNCSRSQQVRRYWPREVWECTKRMVASSGSTPYLELSVTAGSPKIPLNYISKNLVEQSMVIRIRITFCAQFHPATGIIHHHTDSARKNYILPTTPALASVPVATSPSSVSKPKYGAMKQPLSSPAKVHGVDSVCATWLPEWSKNNHSTVE